MRLAALFWVLLAGVSAAEQEAGTRLGAFTAPIEAPTHRYGHGIMGDLPEWGPFVPDRTRGADVRHLAPECGVQRYGPASGRSGS
ncbi:hypothetical protein SULPSESMR1_00835 [Pseudosulfitobacter pseudonitzschiae]|uniref:Uncharacterized protein n=1 Tax=Pseudosulfitobacter pseudonitzschiae TaxID=1402135 RepID=A0A221JY61_9RHOB|nr:hypothetical protein SULPSESMR1_00835 [Pseudosulfitobacter pseudonitzschiae]